LISRFLFLDSCSPLRPNIGLISGIPSGWEVWRNRDFVSREMENFLFQDIDQVNPKFYSVIARHLRTQFQGYMRPTYEGAIVTICIRDPVDLALVRTRKTQQSNRHVIGCAATAGTIVSTHIFSLLGRELRIDASNSSGTASRLHEQGYIMRPC